MQLGALATMFRQTNIIWMFFIAANSAVSYAENLYGQDSVLQNKHKTMLEDNDLLSDNRSTPISSGLRKRRMHNSSSNSQQSVFKRSKFSLHHPPGTVETVVNRIYVQLGCQLLFSENSVKDISQAIIK